MLKPYLALVFIICSCTLVFSQSSKLDRAKESLTDSSTPTSISNSESNNRNDSSGSGSLLGSLILDIFAYTAYGVLVESPWEMDTDMHFANFTNYPYQNRGIGNFTYSNLGEDIKLSRLDIRNTFLLGSRNLFGSHFGAEFRFFQRMNLEVEHLQLFEFINGDTETFSLTSILLNYHRIRTQNVDLYFGIGVMHVGSGVNETGLSYNIGAEWFIRKPLSLLVSHKGTSINSQPVRKTKAVVKYHFKNYHASVGQEYFTLGDIQINPFSIGIGASF
ncbi:MAG: hypothetical protein AAF901_06060 [Bacteroidota bacterium]